MGNETDIIQLITEHGLRPTANRILVARTLAESERPLSLSELESMIETVDKSGIFRTLTLFRENHLVHSVEDGSNLARYELCHSHNHEEDDDTHVHFYCERCHRLICLTDIPTPSVSLPEGYDISSSNFLVKGICPSCKVSLQSDHT